MKFALSLSFLLASSVLAQSSSESVSVSEAAASAAESASTTSASVPSVAAQVTSAESSSVPARSTTKTRSAGSSAVSNTPVVQTAATAVIPKGISQSCTEFLNTLNSDSALSSCTSPLLSATAEFTSDNASSSSARLSSTLNTLCSASGCSDTVVRRHLSNFYTACKVELTGASPNTNVRQIYDILYTINPLRDAMCTKDPTSKQYCVLQPSSSSSSTGSKNVLNSLSDPVSDAVAQFKQYGSIHARSASIPTYGLSARQAEAVMQSPNMTAIQNTGLPYLFMQASLEPSALCTKCTQAILAAYAKWENQIPYAFGLNNSPMLGGQAELWKQVEQKCGSGFLSVVNSASGDANVANGATSVIPGLRGLAVSAAMMLGVWVIL